MMYRAGRTGLIILAVVTVLAVAVLTAWHYVGSASITGGTSQERIASINKLADDRAAGAANAFALAARKETDAEVRAAALYALGRFLNASHRPVILEASRDLDSGVRCAAARVLGQFGDDAAVDRLAEMLADAFADVPLAALAALQHCASSKSYIPLVQAMEKGEPAALRVKAMQCLNFKAGAERASPVDPANTAQWHHYVESIKQRPPVVEAFKRYGVALDAHPEQIIPGPSEH